MANNGSHSVRICVCVVSFLSVFDFYFSSVLGCAMLSGALAAVCAPLLNAMGSIDSWF